MSRPLQAPRAAVLLTTLAVLLLVPSLARAAGDGQIVISRIEVADFPQMRAFVTVSDDDGRPYTGLTPDTFVITEDGATVAPVVREEVDLQIPIAIVFVVDTSGSMADAEDDPDGNGGLSATIAALERIIPTLGPTDQIAVISFANEVTEADWTTDQAVVLERVRALSAAGNTALYDAAVRGITLANRASLVRRSVVLLTDGEESGGKSTNTRQAVLDLATETGIPIFTIGFGEGAARDFLDKLAGNSGGRFKAVAQPEDIDATIADFTLELRRGYTLEWTSGLPADGATHKVTITVTTRSGPTSDERAINTLPVPPTISVPLLESGDALEGIVEFGATMTAQGTPALVVYELDGRVVHSDDQAPFNFSLDTRTLERGEHQLVVYATDSDANKTFVEYTFELSGDVLNIAWVFLVVGAAAAVGAAFVVATRRRRRLLATPIGAPEVALDAEVSEVGGPISEPPPVTLASLIVRAGPGEGSLYPVFEDTRLGREPSSTVHLADETSTVSRQHARIWMGASQEWLIEDLGSTGGTRVDGDRITAATVLYEGSRIEIGPYVLEFARTTPA